MEAEFNPENPYQVSHARKGAECLATSVRLDLALPPRGFVGGASHSSRCQGHGAGRRNVTANLSESVCFLMRGATFLSAPRRDE